jgi:hypothetical protein
MKKTEILIKTLKEIGFAKELVSYLNSVIPKKLYSVAKDKGMSINQYLDAIEDDAGQHTVVMTSLISYDGVKAFLIFEANKFLSKMTNGSVKVLSKSEYRSNPNFIEYADLAFDIIFEVDGELVPLEIKVTQNTSGFTGATHSTSKVNDYLLILLEIDRDVIVADGIDFVKSIFMSITSIDGSSWKGEASSNSSWTQFKFKVHDSNSNVIDYSSGIICGSLKMNRTNYSMITESL